MKCFMKKGTVANKIGIMVVTLSLSMAMLTGCGNRADRNSDEVSTEAAPDSAGMVHLESVDEVSDIRPARYGRICGGA